MRALSNDEKRAKMTIAAYCSFLSLIWFRCEMKEWGDGSIADLFRGLLKQMRDLTLICYGQALTWRFDKKTQYTVKKNKDLYDRLYKQIKRRTADTTIVQGAIAFLETSNDLMCDVVAVCGDVMTREWRLLYETQRNVLEGYLFPAFPESEGIGVEMYMQHYRGA